MNSTIKIKQVENGYFVTVNSATVYVYTDLEDVFRRLLAVFESRYQHSHGTQYGDVKILREKEK